MLQSFLFEIKDHRRQQGRRYQLGQILLFSVSAILGNATSYRKVHAFVKAHYETLDQTCGLHWKRLPAYTTVRAILQGTSAAALEAGFREYRARLASSATAKQFVSFDGQVLRGSFDHFQDQKAIQILSAFLADRRSMLAHEEIARQTNESPTAQELMTAWGLANCIFTFDAIHGQEKTLAVAQETGNAGIVQVQGNQRPYSRTVKPWQLRWRLMQPSKSPPPRPLIGLSGVVSRSSRTHDAGMLTSGAGLRRWCRWSANAGATTHKMTLGNPAMKLPTTSPPPFLAPQPSVKRSAIIGPSRMAITASET